MPRGEMVNILVEGFQAGGLEEDQRGGLWMQGKRT